MADNSMMSLIMGSAILKARGLEFNEALKASLPVSFSQTNPMLGTLLLIPQIDEKLDRATKLAKAQNDLAIAQLPLETAISITTDSSSSTFVRLTVRIQGKNSNFEIENRPNWLGFADATGDGSAIFSFFAKDVKAPFDFTVSITTDGATRRLRFQS